MSCCSFSFIYIYCMHSLRELRLLKANLEISFSLQNRLGWELTGSMFSWRIRLGREPLQFWFNIVTVIQVILKLQPQLTPQFPLLSKIDVKQILPHSCRSSLVNRCNG